MVNVLFVGGGRRVELAQKFIARGYTVFAYEKFDNVPISDIATIIKGLSWTDQALFPHLYETIIKNDIKLVIPLQDAAVEKCALFNDYYALEPWQPKPVILVSSYETGNLCHDKQAFATFCEERFGAVYPANNGTFPYYIKPRFGFGSQNCHVLYNESDRDRVAEIYGPAFDHKFVSQRYIQGHEYSVDSYFDKDGKWVESVPRIRLRVGSGEVITSKIAYHVGLRYWTKLVGEALGIRGPNNTQWIIDKSEHPWLIEVNARFGGGYTFSMEAGLDAISLIERDYFDKDYHYTGIIRDGLLLERSYKDHYYETRN
jgi:carbamoyl-phosphate synthase large subunit